MLKTVASVLAAIAVSACACGHLSDHIAGNLPSSPNDTRQVHAPIATPKPIVRPDAVIVADLAGAGDHQTSPFSTTGAWYVEWSFDCLPLAKQQGIPPYRVELTILVLDKAGVMEQQFAPVTVLSSGTTGTQYYNERTDFSSLLVSAPCPWHVTVTG